MLLRLGGVGAACLPEPPQSCAHAAATNSRCAHRVQAAYDPVYGARPLRRWLEQTVITQLSRMIVAGDLQDNSDVYCDAGVAAAGQAAAGGLVYQVVPKAAPAGGDAGADGGGFGSIAEALKRGRTAELARAGSDLMVDDDQD
jgi:hypothetical protein